MSERSIYWSVTINNPNSGDEECLALARQRGWIVEGQIEVGNNGTPHYQLLVNTRSQQRFTALKRVFPRGHIEAARRPSALKNYVHKTETCVSELPNSEKFISSQKQLWNLVVDELELNDADKKYRIQFAEDRSYADDFDPLKALDYACDRLIRRCFYCVETFAVNPQVRSAWLKFWRAIVDRRQQDRQTDRQAELLSQHVDIPTVKDANEDSGSEARLPQAGGSETEESEDYEDSESEATEGSDESRSTCGSESDASS